MVVDVFVDLIGQEDNLGDSVLRRGLLNALRGSERRFHIFIGDHTPSYTSALGLRDDDRLYRSKLRWTAASIARSARGIVLLAANPGESSINTSGTASRFGRLLHSRLLRMTGARIAFTGSGVKDPTIVPARATVSMVKSCTVVSWRDAESARLFGIGSVVADWAYAEGPSTTRSGTPDRPFLALSMRGDRPEPDSAWISAVHSLCAAHSLRPIFIAQVERDNERADRLASRLDGEVDLWGAGTDHHRRECAVRDVYSRSAFVAGDRLHALIIGMTEGAIPVILPTSAEAGRKLTRVLGVTDSVVDVGTGLDLAEAQDSLGSQIEQARLSLERLQASMTGR